MQGVAGGGEGIGLFLTIGADWEHSYQGVNSLLTRPSSKLEKQCYRTQLGVSLSAASAFSSRVGWEVL